MSESPHPSFLALDRAALAASPGPALADHLAACPTCRDHVTRVRDGVGADLPGWLGQLAAPTPGPRARSWRWLGGGLALAAATAIVLVVVRAPGSEVPAFTARKGAPSVAVHILRDGQVSLWDGRAPVRPGDRLRLEIAADGMHQIGVFATTGAGDAVVHRPLYQAALPAQPGPALLPTAWQVDAAPGPETFVVVLSDRPISPNVIDRDPRLNARDGVWLTTLRFPKQIPEAPRP